MYICFILFVTYIKTPIHFHNIRMIQCNQSLPLPKNFLLLACFHYFMFLYHFYSVEFPGVLLFRHENLTIGTFPY